MPRLRNSRTGAVVSCSEATAVRMGSEWTADKPTPKSPAKKSTSKKSDDE